MARESPKQSDGYVIIPHVSTPSDSLESRYPQRAHDLARYLDTPIDDEIASFVAEVMSCAADAHQLARSEVTNDGAYVLLQFARRRSVKAIRERDITCSLQAVDALTLVDRAKIDFRDFSVDFPLLTARLLDQPYEELIDRAVFQSAPATAESFEAARGRIKDLTIANCALLEVESSYGTGFMDKWTSTYDTDTQIAERAIRLADEIDAESSYVVSNLRITELPEVWFSAPRPTSNHIPTLGCAMISSDHKASSHLYSHGLLVFVAQVKNRRTSRSLERKANAASTVDRRPRAAISVGTRLAIFVGGSTTQGEVALESASTLERFCRLALPLL
jgi:hypothetical protein